MPTSPSDEPTPDEQTEAETINLEDLPAEPHRWRNLTPSQQAWAKEYGFTPRQAQEMAMYL